MNIWDLVSLVAGLICFFVLVLVGWAIIAGLIDGIKKAYKERTK
nr:MAG TPA: cellulose biosynthesis protein [Caudoviricetes sp.]